MIRRLLAFFRRRGMVVDYEGHSYRQELLRAIVRLNARPDLDPARLEALRALLKDLHALDYSLAANAEDELRQALLGLQQRVEQLEGIANVRRLPGVGKKVPGVLA